MLGNAWVAPSQDIATTDAQYPAAHSAACTDRTLDCIDCLRRKVRNGDAGASNRALLPLVAAVDVGRAGTGRTGAKVLVAFSGIERFPHGVCRLDRNSTASAVAGENCFNKDGRSAAGSSSVETRIG